MKVILAQDVKGLGKKGEMVNASDGHARNYLIPRGLAVEANAANMNVMKTKQAAEETRKARELAAAKETAAKINGSTVTIKGKAGENGRLFGSITSMDIAAEVKKQLGIELDKKKIIVTDAIKGLGTFEAEARIYTDVNAKFSVKVVQE